MGILKGQDESDDWRYIVTFLLDQQTYAVPIESVVKITELSALIACPRPASNIVGWIQISDQKIPAVNMRRHHGLTETVLDAHTPVIVVQIDETQLALVVDRLSGALRVPAAQITHSFEMLPGTMMQTPRGNTVLVNLAHLFPPEQMKSFYNLQA